MNELSELSQQLLEVGRLASILVMQGYRKRPEASKKEPRDLVTEFDLRSQELIANELSKRLPGIAILAEEGATPGEPVTGTALKSQGRHTPFAGLELPGRVRFTVVSGHVAYEAA